MNGRSNILPLIDSVSFSMKYLKEPWAFLSILMNRPRDVSFKGFKERITIKNKFEFWKLRNIVYRGWKIVDYKAPLFHVKRGNITICAPLEQLGVLQEPLEKYYKVVDFENKRVLDIGGYIGYSAVLFSKWGAKDVIVYEAQRENIDLIRKNLKLNSVRGRVYGIAVAEKDGMIELFYEKMGTTNFGLKGDKKYRVRTISVSKVLSEHSIDIAKFDCEGCEYSLLSVSCDVIRRIPVYIIEYHRGLEKLKEKFENCGYYVKRLWKINENVGGLKAEVRR